MGRVLFGFPTGADFSGAEVLAASVGNEDGAHERLMSKK